jgi:hypothetical protein
MTIEDKIYEAWDKAVYMAMEGETKLMAAFLRAHPVPPRGIDLDLVRLADVLDGRLKRGRGKPSAAARAARATDPYLRAATGDNEPLVALLGKAHVESYSEIPDFLLLAEIVRGDFNRLPGPHAGHKIKRGLDAIPVVMRVREMQVKLKRMRNNSSLKRAFEAVAAEIHKSEEWVRDEYYKMGRHVPRHDDRAADDPIEGVALLDDTHVDLPDEVVRDHLSAPRKGANSK